jgi:hypothetical protein
VDVVTVLYEAPGKENFFPENKSAEETCHLKLGMSGHYGSGSLKLVTR